MWSVTLHVSVWVEIWNERHRGRGNRGHAPRERVSWNEILFRLRSIKNRHAPRERVSWNCFCSIKWIKCNPSRSTWACELKFEMKDTEEEETEVTLHVSVWVEITEKNFFKTGTKVTLHVSVWVEISQIMYALLHHYVTLHVSVWVEIVNWKKVECTARSRSTWACELKCIIFIKIVPVFASRSTWACELKLCNRQNKSLSTGVTLHVSVWVEIVSVP